MLKPPLDSESLRILFTKPYGQPGPTAEQWKAVYAEDVVFIDPTQEKRGVESYIRAQDGLMRRCDDVFLETESLAINNDVAFVEWRMGLKIKGIEFIYPGATRLRFNDAGLVPVIAQDFETGKVLMLAWMNRVALELSLIHI